MPVREGPAQSAPPPKGSKPYPAEKARGGEIVLRSRWQRIIFISGLVAAAIVAIALFIMAA